jgi:putative transposase
MKNIPQYLQVLARQKMESKVQSMLDFNLLQKWASEAIAKQVSEALDAQMLKERDEYVGRQPYQREAEPVHRNGFKRVFIPFLGGRLGLKQPVLRRGGFVSPTLKVLRLAGKSLVSLLGGRLWLKGIGTRDAAAEINATFGTHLSKNTITQVTQTLVPAMQEWEKQPLPKDLVFLYLDAMYLTARRKEHFEKTALLVAIGVDKNLKRHFLGFLTGSSERRETWGALIQNLLERGLMTSELQLVISDAHEGIREAVKDLLKTPHQLCVIHKRKNACARVAHSNQKAFREDFKRVFWAESRSQALVALGQLKANWEKIHLKAVETVERDLEEYLRFYDLEPKFWSLTRCSNLIERLMEEFRRRFRPARGMQNEFELEKLVYAVATAQQERWNHHKAHTSRKGKLAQAA